MGKPHSKDLRSHFVALLDAGTSASGAGKQLLVPRSTATRWSAIWTTEKRCEALPMGGDRRSAELEEHSAFILSRVEENAPPIPPVDLEVTTIANKCRMMKPDDKALFASIADLLAARSRN